MSWLAFPAMLLVVASTVSAAQHPLSITRVATDRSSFEPGKGQGVILRYRVSQPATLTIAFIGPDGHRVRRIQEKIKQAGEQRFRWDGKDNKGRQVSPEAYLYTLTAQSDAGEKATYDPSLKTGGEQVYPQQLALDTKTGAIHYRLAKPARVRLIISGEAQYWPVRTLLDWAPRANGVQTETWDGWDAGHIVHALKRGKMIPIFYAFALPRNAVIVKGKAANATSPLGGKGASNNVSSIPVPLVDVRMLPRTRGSAPIYFHATHPWARCYNPVIEARLPAGLKKNKKGLPLIQHATPLSLNIAKYPPPGRLQPIKRVSVFIYVDGKMVERLLSGYTPYHWIIDPATLTPGEHVITGLFSWRDDHFGIVHKKVWVEQLPKNAPRQGTANNTPSTTLGKRWLIPPFVVSLSNHERRN